MDIAQRMTVPARDGGTSQPSLARAGASQPLLALAGASLPLLAATVSTLAMPALTLDVVLSFAILGFAVSLQAWQALRGRAATAVDASVFSFCLMFLLVGPLVQFGVQGWNLVNTVHAQPELVVRTNLACALFCAVYALARMTVLRDAAGATAAVAAPSRLQPSLFGLAALAALSVLITLIAMSLAGASAADQGTATVLLAFRKFVFFIPTALLLVLVAAWPGFELRRSFPAWLLLALMLVCVLLTQNPGTEKRNALGPVYLSLLFLVLRHRLSLRGVQSALLVAVLLVLFPFMSLFTHVRIERLVADDFGWHIYSEHFLSVHYDAWANVYAAVERVERRGLMGGEQLSGALLFFVPSTWWSDKPLASGIVIARYLMDHYTMWFTNLSAPLPSEGYLDFGYPGVAAYALAMAALARALQRMATAGRGATALAVAVYLSFFSVFLLRGSLMVAVAYGSGALVAFGVAHLLLRALGRTASRPRGHWALPGGTR